MLMMLVVGMCAILTLLDLLGSITNVLGWNVGHIRVLYGLVHLLPLITPQHSCVHFKGKSYI